jgi:hypothetical protein
LNPTSKLTFADLNIRIPALIICLQNVPLAFFFHYAYPYTPYVTTLESNEKYHGGFLGWKGWISVFNPMEVARGVIFSFRMAAQLQARDDGVNSSEGDVSMTSLHHNGIKTGLSID